MFRIAIIPVIIAGLILIKSTETDIQPLIESVTEACALDCWPYYGKDTFYVSEMESSGDNETK